MEGRTRRENSKSDILSLPLLLLMCSVVELLILVGKSWIKFLVSCFSAIYNLKNFNSLLLSWWFWIWAFEGEKQINGNFWANKMLYRAFFLVH